MRHLFRTVTLSMIAALAFASPSLAHDFKIADLKIGHPYARAMLPGAKVGGGYLTINNTGATDDRLVSIASPSAGTVQLHEMKVDDGVMTMREIKGGIVIPKGETLALKPGGYHLMFVNVKQPFKEGENVKATLTFEKAGPVEVEFAIGAANGAHDMTDGMDPAAHVADQ